LLLFFPAAGMRDAAIFRAAVRRLMLLDDPRDVEGDQELLGRGAAIVREMFGSTGPPPQGPPREELLKVLGTAAKIA
jgi:hypothetical protein